MSPHSLSGEEARERFLDGSTAASTIRTDFLATAPEADEVEGVCEDCPWLADELDLDFFFEGIVPRTVGIVVTRGTWRGRGSAVVSETLVCLFF